jgi:hypothetical protein
MERQLSNYGRDFVYGNSNEIAQLYRRGGENFSDFVPSKMKKILSRL